MSPHYCAITACRALLLGLAYYGVVMDNGTTIAVCPSCMRKIRECRTLQVTR